jgi:hypothetical protein
MARDPYKQFDDMRKGQRRTPPMIRESPEVRQGIRRGAQFAREVHKSMFGKPSVKVPVQGKPGRK